MPELAMRDLPQTAIHPPEGGGQDAFFAGIDPVPRPLIVKAKGIYLYDDAGRDYLDLGSGPVVSNIGHGNQLVAEVMAQQAKTVDFAYFRHARHQPNIDLTARIAELAGPGFERVALTSGGSEAMECAVKFLRQHALFKGEPNRRKLISCDISYHGGTMLGLALSGAPELQPFIEGMVTPSIKVPTPLTYRLPANHTAETWAKACADALEAAIEREGAGTILAFVVEPVGGLATGCHVPPASYFKRIREITRRHGIALVFDEVLCGTGRTGRFLAAHNWPDALPDIVVMAKGLASGYAPLGATLVPARLADPLAAATGYAMFHTYSANPISCATGMAVLDEYERRDLTEHAAERGRYLRERIEALKPRFRSIGDLRGLGLVMALEVVRDRATKAVFPPEVSPVDMLKVAGLKNGLLIYARRTAQGRNGDWIMVSPPMTITKPECDELICRLSATLADFEADVNHRKLFSADRTLVGAAGR